MNNLPYFSALADALWRHESRGGGADSRRRELTIWTDATTRAALHVDLLRSDLARAPHRPAELKSAQSELDDPARTIELCRGVYEDASAIQASVSWSDFAPLGYSARDLQLRYDGDPCCLGEEVDGGFQIEARVGNGSFGTVFRALQKPANEWVAVKVPRGASSHAQQHAATLLCREADILSGISSTDVPRFVQLLPAHEDRPPLLVMEFVEGQRLSAIVRRTPLDVRQACEVVAILAEVVDRMHTRQFIHRDIKPDNVVIRQNGRPCLLDMGVTFAEQDRFTKEGRVIGTLNYMAPEGLLGMTSQLDGRSDIWSLGAVLYELLTGHVLQQISNREEALVAAVALRRDKPPFADLIPESLRQICLQCLAREPLDRFNTAAELALALRQWMQGDTVNNVPREPSALASWRLGMKLGAAVENHAFLGRYLHQVTQLRQRDNAQRQDVDKALASALAYGMAVTISLEELATQAGKLSMDLPTLGIARQLQSKFYKKDRSSENEAWLQEQVPVINEHLELLYHRVLSALRNDDDNLAAYCELATRCTVILLSQEEVDDLDELWQRMEVPGGLWRRFKDTIGRPNAGKQALIQLDKGIERYFLYDEVFERA